MKVLVAVVPLAGHVGPVSGLVAELVSRRHQVRVYTGARYRQRWAPDPTLRPLVVVTQGTIDVDPADLIQPALQGLADLDVAVIATSGRRLESRQHAAPTALGGAPVAADLLERLAETRAPVRRR